MCKVYLCFTWNILRIGLYLCFTWNILILLLFIVFHVKHYGLLRYFIAINMLFRSNIHLLCRFSANNLYFPLLIILLLMLFILYVRLYAVLLWLSKNVKQFASIISFSRCLFVIIVFFVWYVALFTVPDTFRVLTTAQPL